MGRMDRIGWIVSAGLYQLDRIGIGLGYDDSYRKAMEKWDGLYSRDTISNKSHQHGRGKIIHHEKLTRKEATKAVPMWLHQALTSFLQ